MPAGKNFYKWHESARVLTISEQKGSYESRLKESWGKLLEVIRTI